MFFIRHGGCFTGGASDDNGIGAMLDLEFTQLRQDVEMDTRFGKRCDDGDTGSLEQGLFHKVILQKGLYFERYDWNSCKNALAVRWLRL